MMTSVGAAFPLLIVLLQGLSGALVALLLGMFFYFFLGVSAIDHKPPPKRGDLIQPVPASPVAPVQPKAGLV